ncbi:hypothetical protein, partial [Mycobacterium sp.]|uniref:hypothetical protein n=1 Tax=Mycobacterium sp. TaxID=1785 RepID=UPI0025EDA5E6
RTTVTKPGRNTPAATLPGVPRRRYARALLGRLVSPLAHDHRDIVGGHDEAGRSCRRDCYAVGSEHQPNGNGDQGNCPQIQFRYCAHLGAGSLSHLR